METGSDIDVSVVIPTFRRPDSVRRLLLALARQELAAERFEVLVSSNGPEVGTLRIVEGFAAPFALRGLHRNEPGRAGACNAGARVARGMVIVILDDDMEPDPGCLGAHLACHQRTPEPRGVVGPAPINVEADSPPVVRFRHQVFERKLSALATRAGDLRITDVYTGNFSIRRDVFGSVGGFDEEFRIYGHEDYEFALRLSARGVTFVFAPDAIAKQSYSKSITELVEDIVSEGSTAVLFADKHPHMLSSMPLARWPDRSRKARIRLRILLGISELHRAMPRLLSRYVSWYADRWPERAEHQFRLVLDYCYWLGAQRALRRQGVGGWGIEVLDRWRRQGFTAHKPTTTGKVKS
jgi:GT2 family glycosyltransferase